MARQIPQEKLDFLNSLLDRELEGLERPDKPIFWNQSNNKEESFDEFIQIKEVSGDISKLQSRLQNLESKLIEERPQLQHGSESDDQTPLKNIYTHEESSGKKRIKFSNDIKQNKSQTRKSPQRNNKFQLERSIEEAENRLQLSKSSLRRSHSRKDSQGLGRSSSVRSKISNDGNVDMAQLQKKLNSMKKAQDEERQILIKEKQKNQQLIQQVALLNRQIKKLQLGSSKSTQLEQDYQRLLENFEKSEYIRQQQKTLIQNLKLEIEVLKHPESVMKENKAPQKKKKSKL